MVAVGDTACVPPVAASVNVALSILLEITTVVALLAVTVRVVELPCVIAVGLAVIVTVGAPVLAVTVIVACAVTVPPAPVAVAVYVVVALGVTACVPPAGASVKVALSLLSEITTVVALLAVTVRLEELPAGTVPGLAVIATVGSGGGGLVCATTLPQDVRASDAMHVSAA